MSGDANLWRWSRPGGPLLVRATPGLVAGGKVTQISEDALVITEYFTTPDGKTTANPVTLAIKSEKPPEQETDLATGKSY